MFREKRQEKQGVFPQFSIFAKGRIDFKSFPVQKVEKAGKLILFRERGTSPEYKGEIVMNQTLSSVLKGAAAGAAVGTAAYMVMGTGKNKVRKMKKKAARAMKTVGGVFDSLAGMM